MESITWFKENLFTTSQQNFEERALGLFRLQSKLNPFYSQFIQYLNIDPKKIESVQDIPFLPIEFFKTMDIKTGIWTSKKKFLSSGTTKTGRSKHLIEDEEYYHRIALAIFESDFGSLSDYRICALLPSYLEQGDSSLISMVNYFIQRGKPGSGYFLENSSQLINYLEDEVPTVLFGVTYALLDLIHLDRLIITRNCTIIETGGMKGRKEEITKMEYLEILSSGFKNASIRTEYGMTELLSQAYGNENRYHFPEWAKMLVRDLNDPISTTYLGKGAANIIDLANSHSCAFIASKDLCEIADFNYFKILGRMDNSDIRGCSLLV